MAQELKYTLLVASEINNVDYSEIIGVSPANIRWNLDDTLFVIKWIASNPTPSFVPASSAIYTNSEVRAEMITQGNWNNPLVE